MKKVLALVLAVMMLSTMAFASNVGNPGNPSGEITDEDNSVHFGGSIAPGDCLYVYKGMAETVPGTDASSVNQVDWNAQITSDNYSITSQKWTKGKNLISSIEFDDDLNQLVIKTKEDYTLKQPQDLKGKFTLKGKGKGGTNSTKPVNITITIDIDVGNHKAAAYLDADNDRTIPQGLIADNMVYKFQKIDAAKDGLRDFIDSSNAHATSEYGTVVLNTADDDTEVTFRGYKGEELFLFNKTAANSALLKQYADKDADITFLTFVANPTLTSTATIRFYKDEESHVYVLKDGKISSEVKWDDEESCFLLKARTLGAYVFSDKALPIGTTAADNNPDTGANDVVGIATALAAVALVSAAAVSLKK